MKRVSFVVLGGLVVIVELLAVVFVGSEVATSPLTYLLGLAGLLFAVGGADPFPERLPGYYLIGSGNVLIGLGFGAYGTLQVLDGGAVGVAYTIVGLIVVASGITWFYDGWETVGVFGSGARERDATE